MAITFRELHHNAVMNPRKKKKPYFLKTSVSTAAIKAGQCRTGRTHKSTTFKAKSKAKGMKPNNKTPSYI